jgi:Ca2+/Na+ antiporter
VPPAAAHKKQDIESGGGGGIAAVDGEDVEIEEEEDDHANAPTIKGVGFLLVGGLLIFVCSSPFITAVVEASALLKVSPTLLAFFLAPVASEMPEILEAVSLSRRGHVQAINVAYSNLIGGTITKTTLMCGIFSLFGVWKEFAWEVPNYSFSLCLLAGCALVAAVVGFLPGELLRIFRCFEFF